MLNSEAIARPIVVPEKRMFFRGRGLIGTLILVPVFIAVLFSKPAADLGTWLRCVFFALAWLCFIAGAGMRCWATLYVGGRKRHRIVQEGPYSMCRNPLYLGSLLLALSVGLFLQSLTFAAFVGVAGLCYIFLVLPAEEADLREIHGIAYEDYCARVPRIMPRLTLFFTPAEIRVSTKGLRMEARRALRWAFLPILCQIIVQCRLQDWWPHWRHLW